MQTEHNRYCVTQSEIDREYKLAMAHIRKDNKGQRIKSDGWNIRVTEWGYCLQVCYFDNDGLKTYNVAM